MAIFNRNRERWYPTKPLAKTSKNKTIEIEREPTSSTSPKAYKVNTRLWYWLDIETVGTSEVTKLHGLNADANAHELKTFTRREHDTDNTPPLLRDITAARFDHEALIFGLDTNNPGFLAQNTDASGVNLAEMLFTKGATNYVEADSRCLMSMWVKVPSFSPAGFNSHGHTLGGFCKIVPTDDITTSNEPEDIKPSIGFYINASGQFSIRFTRHKSGTSSPTQASFKFKIMGNHANIVADDKLSFQVDADGTGGAQHYEFKAVTSGASDTTWATGDGTSGDPYAARIRIGNSQSAADVAGAMRTVVLSNSGGNFSGNNWTIGAVGADSGGQSFTVTRNSGGSASHNATISGSNGQWKDSSNNIEGELTVTSYAAAQPYAVTSDVDFASVTTTQPLIQDEWNFVTISIETLTPATDSTYGVAATNTLSNISIQSLCSNASNRVRIWLNGHESSVARYAPAAMSADGWGEGNNPYNERHELVLGNTPGFFGKRDNTVLYRGKGFAGEIGEFSVLQLGTQDPSITAKFLYEAYREGVYGVHSGAHNPVPMLGRNNHYDFNSGGVGINFEKFPRPYPPNKGGFDQHTMTTSSGSIFKEGYLPGTDEFDKNPSMFWRQPLTGSSDSNANVQKDFDILPHLQTSVGDPIVPTWLSSARSKIFSEDLDVSTGFVINLDETSRAISEAGLYPNRITNQTVGPFNDITTKKSNTVGEYENCFTIDIPISHGNTACEMTTDNSGETSLISGNSDTLNHTAYFYGGYTMYLEQGNLNDDFGKLITYGLVKETGTLDTDYMGYTSGGSAKNGGGWLDVKDNNITYKRSDFFEFDGSEADGDGMTIPGSPVHMDNGEVDAWWGTITVLKHMLHWQLEVPVTVSAPYAGPGDYFWDKVVYNGDGIQNSFADNDIVTFWKVNPLWANVVWHILQIPVSTWDLTNGMPTKNYTQPKVPLNQSTYHWVFMAIHLLKSWTSGYYLRGGSTAFSGDLFTSDDVPTTEYWKQGGPFPMSEIDSTNTTWKYHGFFYPLPAPADLSGDLTTIRNNYSSGTWWGSGVKRSQYLTEGTNDYFSMQNVTAGTMALTNPQIRMKTMAYHNFSTGNWETLSGGKGSSDGFSTTNATLPDMLYFADDATIGFSPMTGLMYPYTIDKLEEVIDSAGRPTDAFGFPFHDKYKSNANQTFNLSDYISEPVILKGWELKMDVVPRVTSQDASGISYDGTAWYPEWYFAGESNVVFSGDLPSPHIWYESGSGVTTKTPGMTYPTRNDVYNRSHNNAKGQLTKGVTAFLLKESNSQEEVKIKDMYYRSPHEYSFYSNCISGGSIPLGTKSPEIILTGSFQPVSNGQLSLNASTTLTGGPITDAYFQSNSSRELIGYLQHVYHNDEYFSSNDIFRVRSSQQYLGDLNQIGVSQTVNFGSLFDRENTTYVKLLNNNSSTQEMFVKGSVKLNSKSTNQSVVSPFFLRTGTQSGNMDPDHIGLDFNVSSQSPGQVFSSNYSIFNSWDGGFGSGELVDGMTIPSVTGQKLGDVFPIPKFCLPASDTATKATIKKIDHLSLESSLDLQSDTDVILYPDDNLILGIQDSIATNIGSQIIDHSGNLWKFGRQSLQIPAAQKHSYIRLYLERRRENKPIVVRSNQSHGFSASVCEDLGDTMLLDQYEVAPLRIYSGSFPDDIMSEHPQTSSFSELRVSYNQFRGPETSQGAAFSGALQVMPAITNHATLDAIKEFYWNNSPSAFIRITCSHENRRGPSGNGVAITFTNEDASAAGVVSYSDSGSGTLSIKYDEGVTTADTIISKINAVDGFSAVLATGNGTAVGQSAIIGGPYTFAGGAYHDLDPVITHGGTYPPLEYNWIFFNEKTFKDRTPSNHSHSSCFYAKKPNFQVTSIFSTTTHFYNGTVTSENTGGTDWGDLSEQLGCMSVGMWPVCGAMAAGSSNKVNPWPAFNGQSTNLRLGGCSALWELNRNPSRVAPTADDDKMTVANDGDFSWGTGAGVQVPSFSSWKFKAILPIFSTAYTEIKFDYILFQVRLICIDQDEKPQAYNPLNSSWEDLEPGDIFFYSTTASDATRGSHAIKVNKWNGSTATGHTHTGALWSQHMYGSSASKYADLYCVAASGKVYGSNIGVDAFNHFGSHGTDAIGCWENHSGGSKLSWDAMMNGIKKVLEQETLAVQGLHYKITSKHAHEDWFQIEYLDDDFVNDTFLSAIWPGTSVTLEDFFNSLTQFSLMGTTGVEADIPSSTLYAYRANGDGGYSTNHRNKYGQRQYVKEAADGTETSLNPATCPDTDPAMASEYLRVPGQGTDAVDGSAAYNLIHSAEQITIDYSYLPSKDGVKMNVMPKEFTPEVDHELCKIDRKVTYRTTEGTAGPFGSLNKFQVLTQESGNNIFYDSVPRAIFGFSPLEGLQPSTITDYILVEQDTTNGQFFVNASRELPTGWLMENYKDKTALAFKPTSVRMECTASSNVATPSLPTMPGSPGKGTRDDAIYENKDISGNTVSFGTANADGVNDYIDVVDHILETYPIGAPKKIFGDLAGGFGDGPQGKLVYRPSKYEHLGFSSSTTSGVATHFLLRLDPIRGARFGLMNSNPQKKRYTFSGTSYGQWSNFLEQSLDSRFSSDIDDPFDGAVIKLRSVSPNNPFVDMPVQQNRRRNVDTYQRMTYPFFDATGILTVDFENGIIPPTIGGISGPNLSGVTIVPDTGVSIDASGVVIPPTNPNPGTTVNVTGAIRTSRVVAPGNLRNILNDD